MAADGTVWNSELSFAVLHHLAVQPRVRPRVGGLAPAYDAFATATYGGRRQCRLPGALQRAQTFRRAPVMSVAPLPQEKQQVPKQSQLAVVIAGGGSAGMAAAAALAACPAVHVTVFERRPAAPPLTDGPMAHKQDDGVQRQQPQKPSDDSSGLTTESSTSTNEPGVVHFRADIKRVVLNARGAAALRRIGLDLNNQKVYVPWAGMLTHLPGGKTAGGTLPPDTEYYTVDKAELAADASQVAARAGARVRFGYTLESLDLERREAVFTTATMTPSSNIDGTEESSRLVVHFDLFIGSDGATSMTRCELERRGLLNVRTLTKRLPYKQIFLPPLRAFEGFADLWLRATHGWVGAKQMGLTSSAGSEGPWIDGRDAATLAQNSEQSPNGGRRSASISFASLSEARAVSTAEGVRALFEKCFPQISVAYSNFDRESGRRDDVPSGFEEFCEETARSRLWIWEIRSILCSRLAVGNVVLLGDAAHAMSPSLGMGMNSGLEDVSILIDALERQNWEVQPALSSYDADRRKDVHALVKKCHVFTRDYSLIMKEQMLSVATERMLTSALPQIFKKRNAMEDMAAPGIPFYEIVMYLNFYVWCFRLLATFAVVLVASMMVFASYFLRLFVMGRMA